MCGQSEARAGTSKKLAVTSPVHEDSSESDDVDSPHEGQRRRPSTAKTSKVNQGASARGPVTKKLRTKRNLGRIPTAFTRKALQFFGKQEGITFSKAAVEAVENLYVFLIYLFSVF